MTKQEYADLLKDPRWQRKRLEALEHAGWACEKCHRTDKTLNVHHRNYRNGAMPWEYDLGELEVLCEECHSYFHATSRKLAEISRFLWDRNPAALHRLLGYALASRSGACTENEAGSIVNLEGSLELASGVADWFPKFEFQNGETCGGSLWVSQQQEFNVGKLANELADRYWDELYPQKKQAAG